LHDYCCQIVTHEVCNAHGAQSLVRLCIHIWFNMDIVANIHMVNDDVLVCANMLEFFFVRVYFDMSPNLLENIASNMEQIYFFLAHTHKTIIPKTMSPYLTHLVFNIIKNHQSLLYCKDNYKVSYHWYSCPYLIRFILLVH